MVFESSLSGKTVQETRDVPVAISPRGYRGARGRTRKKSVPLPLSGWGALALCALVCAAEILL